MERKLFLLTFALCATFVCLIVLSYNFMPTKHDRYPYLLDKQSGTFKRPRDLMRMSNLINVTQKYIDSTNAFERLYDLVYILNIHNIEMLAVNLEYTNEEQLRMSGWPVASEQKCGQQLAWLVEQLYQLNSSYTMLRGQKGYELTQLVGSIGKPEANLFAEGSVHWSGSYERCRRVTISTKDDEKPFKTRYCWSRMYPKQWPRNETLTPRLAINVGTCLPEACDTLSAHKLARAVSLLVKFEWPQFYAQNLELDSVFCLPDERSPIRRITFGGRLFIGILSAWLALVIIASIIYEITQHKRRQRRPNLKRCLAGAEASLSERFIDSLSIHCSIKRFKSGRLRFDYSQVKYETVEKPRVDLSCLDAFKAVLTVLIVFGHSERLAAFRPRRLVSQVDNYTDTIGNLSLTLFRLTPSFFVYFGVLSAYALKCKFTVDQLASPLIWLKFNIGILIRIGPVYMLVYCFCRLIVPYAGSGPWWDYGVMNITMRADCMSESWLNTIPYLNLPGFPRCLPIGWFLVTYCHMALFLPLIVHVFAKSSNKLHHCLLLLFFCAVPIVQFVADLARSTTIDYTLANYYGGLIIELLHKFDGSPTLSAQNCIIYVVSGCYVGHWLREYEIGQVKQWPNWIRSKITFCTFLILLTTVLFLPFIIYSLSPTPRPLTSFGQIVFLEALVTIGWASLLGILIIYTTSVYNHIAWVRFLGHPFWRTFNRLGLCVYLIHWELMIFIMTSQEFGYPQGAFIECLQYTGVGLFLSIILSLIVHILFESPVTELLTLLVQYAPQAKQNKDIGLTKNATSLKVAGGSFWSSGQNATK